MSPFLKAVQGAALVPQAETACFMMVTISRSLSAQQPKAENYVESFTRPPLFFIRYLLIRMPNLGRGTASPNNVTTERGTALLRAKHPSLLLVQDGDLIRFALGVRRQKHNWLTTHLPRSVNSSDQRRLGVQVHSCFPPLEVDLTNIKVCGHSSSVKHMYAVQGASIIDSGRLSLSGASGLSYTAPSCCSSS